MYLPTTIQGIVVLCVGTTYIDAVVGNFAVVNLRYGAGPGIPIVSEAWTCPAASANLFDNSSSFIFDCARSLRRERQGMHCLFTDAHRLSAAVAYGWCPCLV